MSFAVQLRTFCSARWVRLATYLDTAERRLLVRLYSALELLAWVSGVTYTLPAPRRG